MAPDGDLPIPSVSSQSLPLSLPPSPPSRPPALGHKSVVVYENLQHSNTTLRRGSASHWLQLVTWQ